MHATLTNLIKKEISLDISHVSQGSKSHNYIRDLLKNKSDADLLFPRFIEGDFLSGSYSRDTKNYPLDDIDVMMVIDGSGLYVIQNGKIIDAEVRGSSDQSNPILNHLGTNSLLGSKRVIDLVASALRDSYPNSKVSKDGQSINVWLEAYKLGIDIVPCFHVIPRDGSQDFYYIPEGGNSDGWMKTNPNIDKNISNYLVQRLGDNFKNFVRLIKFWNEKKNNGRLRSYHLETVIWYVMNNYGQKIDDYEHSVSYFFNNCYKLLSNQCEDATSVGGPIDKYLSVADRLSTLEKISETQKHINSANLMRLLNNKNGQISAWEKAFNFQLV